MPTTYNQIQLLQELASYVASQFSVHSYKKRAAAAAADRSISHTAAVNIVAPDPLPFCAPVEPICISRGGSFPVYNTTKNKNNCCS